MTKTREPLSLDVLLFQHSVLRKDGGE